ncbi:MAG: hypothetical protein J0L58_09395 [Burkholderiales bacterium]|nr:hypothetical protein [Burkholderiales bacterium]MBN8552761.1 hypothetical protein [Caulobacterales bacterium]
MKLIAVLALTLLMAQPTRAQPADPVETARTELEAVMTRESLIRELAGMGAMDQLVRQRFLAARRDASDADRERLESEAWPIAEAVDQANTARMRDILAGQDGWFPISQFGRHAADGAYSVVQHSGNLDLMRDTLARMAPLAGTVDLDGSQYARLWDRTAVMEGRPQRYATQGTTCANGRYVLPDDIEDPDNIDVRRAALGLDSSADYVAGLNQAYGRCSSPAGD